MPAFCRCVTQRLVFSRCLSFRSRCFCYVLERHAGTRLKCWHFSVDGRHRRFVCRRHLPFRSDILYRLPSLPKAKQAPTNDIAPHSVCVATEMCFFLLSMVSRRTTDFAMPVSPATLARFDNTRDVPFRSGILRRYFPCVQVSRRFARSFSTTEHSPQSS